ncbi:MAG: FAD:protein FMN transferase [Kiritimatiellae bacterium]|nr:FAD:protein FMN transferase [Kiritimatiellia bacterium]
MLDLGASRGRLNVLGGVAALLLAAGCWRAKIERVEWPVMGTIAAVQIRHGALFYAVTTNSVKGVFEEVELLLNAHSAESELSKLAGLPEDEILAGCDGKTIVRFPWLKTRPCYEAAFKLMRESGGAFNPRWRGPKTLDLGAIAKGFAVDMADKVCYVDHCDALLDLGGNLKALRSESGSHRPWKTGVRNPSGEGFAAVVDLREGEALATSATYYRGSHIYDGRTGMPVSNGVASVTVLCNSAMWADGLSTTLFVLGPEEGRKFLDEKLKALVGDMPVSALWLLADGRQVKFGDDNRFGE